MEARRGTGEESKAKEAMRRDKGSMLLKGPGGAREDSDWDKPLELRLNRSGATAIGTIPCAASETQRQHARSLRLLLWNSCQALLCVSAGNAGAGRHEITGCKDHRSTCGTSREA